MASKHDSYTQYVGGVTEENGALLEKDHTAPPHEHAKEPQARFLACFRNVIAAIHTNTMVCIKCPDQIDVTTAS